MSLAHTMIFNAILAIVNNCCVASVRGTVNGECGHKYAIILIYVGIGQTFASFTRTIGPTFAGFMFAWSEEPGHRWPFNFHFVWDVLAILTALMYWRSTMLPKSLDTMKKEEWDEGEGKGEKNRSAEIGGE